MKALSISFFLVFAVTLIGGANAEDKGLHYEYRYVISGFLLRATVACQGNDNDIDSAMSLLGPDELKAFSKSYPKTIEKWMRSGAEKFNSLAMKDGMASACAYRLKLLNEVKGIAKKDRH